MRDAGHAAWEAPAILPWDAWLANLYDAMLPAEDNAPLLLSPGQARALWRRVIRDSGAVLASPSRAADLAARAWERLHESELGPDDITIDDSPDVGAFLGWARRYEALCNESGWLDHARLTNWLRGRLPGNAGALPERVALAGFDELTPAQSRLCASLEAAGVTVERLSFPERGEHVVRAGCADAASEVTAAALKARRWLEANPSARIGIIVPVLEPRRAAIARALEEALVPASRCSPVPPTDLPFNLSLGPTLRSIGLVADALGALQLMAGSLPWEAAGRLLRSPYFAGAEAERGARAAMDADLRERGARRWTMAMLERAAEGAGAGGFRAAVQRCRGLLEEGMGRARPGIWARRFSDWLDALGWCRGGTLASRDFQAQQAWFDLLREFAALGAVHGAMDAGEARRALAELASDSPFQPQSGAAPVQVLGLLEAAGLDFDHLWVMGLSEEAWPRPPSPNPFLPLVLQRAHGMAHASAERELAWAERVTRRLVGCAPEVVLSWPRRDGDAELAPSPLLPLDAQEVEPEAGGAWRWREPGVAEAGAERTPPPVPAGPVSGGSGVLTDQAACPFRAFAARRLDADPMERPGVALDGRDRGRLVHEALQVFWERTRTQEGLLALEEAELGRRVAAAARAAGQRLKSSLPSQPERFWDLEQRRLERLLSRWLAEESKREPFQVAAAEERTELDLAGLTLTLRVDRRDRLADGRELIIDYKTGATGSTPKAWLSERPDQPQLPSYATALRSPERLAGLAFANVRPRKIGFSGIVERDGSLVQWATGHRWSDKPEACTSMASLTAYWEKNLTVLAAGFRDGVSNTDPNHPRVCDYCRRHVLCRVREQRPFWDGEGDDE